MASNYTSNYNLNQWSASDRVLRTEFNADNAKIDAALAGKASSSSVSSLQTTVDGLKTSKADKTALDALKATVGQHTTTLSGKGNCQIYAGSYQGKGGAGADNPCSLTFANKPMMVVVVSPTGTAMTLYQGQTQGLQGGSHITISWSGNSVRWFHANSETLQMNVRSYTYLVFAFLQAGT